MDIRQLEYFSSIIESGSFRQAAKKHFVSQPCLTIAIKKLEQELNVKLFDRSQYRPQLTEFGKIFLVHVEKILQELTQSNIALSIKKAELESTINIAIPPLVSAYIFPSMLSAFQERSPHAVVNIHEANVEQVVELLDNNTADIGITSITLATKEKFEFVSVTKQSILAALPLGHRFADRKKISLGELRDENFLMVKGSYFPFHVVHMHCKNAGFAPKISVISSQGATLKAMVAKNVGVSFFMEAVLQEAVNIVGIPLDPPIYLDMGLLWHKDKKLNSCTRGFIEFFRTVPHK